MQVLKRVVGEKRRDDVFFFILIDFLLQILFFGLFLFVVYQVGLKRDQDKMNEAVDAAGVSDITELTDDLTRLAPMKLRELNDLIKQLGGPNEVKRLLERAQQEGGAQVSISKLDKLRKLAGADKPSCQFEKATGRPKALMTVLATGKALTIKAGSPELTAMGGQLARGAGVGQSMSPDGFERTFSPLLRLKPTCRYFIKFEERTDLVAPRRAAGRVFYLMVG
jgi:hypothetical protein